MDLRQILIAGFFSFQKCSKQFDLRINQLHPMHHDAGLKPEQLISDFNLGNQILQLCPGIEKVVTPQLGFMLIRWIDAAPALHIFIYPRGNRCKRLTDIKGVPLRETDAFLNCVDLKLSRGCEELSLGC